MTLRDQIVGKMIEALSFENEHYVIRFSDGAGMNVFNFKGDYESDANVGARIADVQRLSSEIIIRLDNGNELVISLREQDYIAPEAFYFYDPRSGLTIVD